MAAVDLERRAEIGRQKRLRTRAAIVEVALRVVAEKGFDAPTIDDFMLAAGVARGTFYNYFQERDELIAAVAAAVVDKVDNSMLPIYQGIPDPAQRATVALRHFISMGKERPDWGWLIVRMMPIAGGPLSEEMRKGVIADLRSGQRKGRFRFSSIEAAVAFCMGVMTMSIRTVLAGDEPADFAESMAAMTLQGLGMPYEEAWRVARLPLPDTSAAEPAPRKDGKAGHALPRPAVAKKLPRRAVQK